MTQAVLESRHDLEAKIQERTMALERLTKIDPLTELFNRRGMTERIEAQLIRGERELLKMGILWIDIDNFKTLNDRHGHAIGDQALLILAGGLLILPGFLGDTIGLLLLIPPVRRLITDAIARRVQVTERFGVRQGPDVVIDGEFIELDPNDGSESPRGNDSRPSGWTRH